ncbi:hypothetical protein ACRPK6_06045 [Exiguobacterium sp. TRN 1102]|uniref:hypothetical protein n=1 Tax=Exiguobacterium sp. TRN 1102 TaxID=3420732 RepID=UPI003D77CD38
MVQEEDLLRLRHPFSVPLNVNVAPGILFANNVTGICANSPTFEREDGCNILDARIEVAGTV